MNKSSSYTRFTSNNPRLDVSFLYPSGWTMREVSGADGDEVFIIGPSNQEKTYAVSVSIIVRPGLKKDGEQFGVRETLEYFVATRQGFPGYKEINRSFGSLADVEAAEVEYKYISPPGIDIPSKETVVTERRIFLNRKGYSYELIYGAAEEEYWTYLEEFRVVARTFEFRDKILKRTYQSLLTPKAV